MPLIDDFANEVNSYPANNVTLTVVDLAVTPTGTVGAINVNEVWAFRVRVANNGTLNMTNVSLLIEGQNGTTVSGIPSTGLWVHSINPLALPALNAHSTQDTGKYYFKAPAGKKPAGTELLRIHVSSYDVNLDWILINNTGDSTTPTKTYTNEVYP